MEDLFLYSKQLVNENINCGLDEEALNLLSLVIMGYLLFNRDLTMNKLIPKLKNLEIHFDNDSLIDMAHKYLNKNFQDDVLKDCDIALFSNIFKNEIKKNTLTIVDNNNYLLVSLKNSKPGDIIAAITHELMHYIRFDGYFIDGKKLLVQNGFYNILFNYDTQNKYEENRSFEEGITDKFSEEIVTLLTEYLKNEDYSINFLNSVKNTLVNYKYTGYKYIRNQINSLCEDDAYNNLLLKHLHNECSLNDVRLYFNNLMNSPEAFEILSEKFDIYLYSDNFIKAIQSIEEISYIIKTYKSKLNNISLKKIND